MSHVAYWLVCLSVCVCSYRCHSGNCIIIRTFSPSYCVVVNSFYAPQLYRQVLLRRVLAMGILSVCLSVCLSVRLSVTTRWYTKPR